MSSAIGKEAHFWLYAVVLGAMLLLLYDILRVFRRIFPHKILAIGVEDFLYWMVSGCLIFRMLYQFNYGIIRWFTVFGMLVGMLLYHLTVSVSFVRVTSKWLGRLIHFIKRPIVWFFGAVCKKMANINSKRKKVTNSLKKKLKRERKEGNMEVAITDRRETVGKRQSKKEGSKTIE